MNGTLRRFIPMSSFMHRQSGSEKRFFRSERKIHIGQNILYSSTIRERAGRDRRPWVRECAVFRAPSNQRKRPWIFTARLAQRIFPFLTKSRFRSPLPPGSVNGRVSAVRLCARSIPPNLAFIFCRRPSSSLWRQSPRFRSKRKVDDWCCLVFPPPVGLSAPPERLAFTGRGLAYTVGNGTGELSAAMALGDNHGTSFGPGLNSGNEAGGFFGLVIGVAQPLALGRLICSQLTQNSTKTSAHNPLPGCSRQSRSLDSRVTCVFVFLRRRAQVFPQIQWKHSTTHLRVEWILSPGRACAPKAGSEAVGGSPRASLPASGLEDFL